MGHKYLVINVKALFMIHIFSPTASLVKIFRVQSKNIFSIEIFFRSWIDNYEEAVTNHYSPELRARLTGAKLPTNFFKPKDVNGIR